MIDSVLDVLLSPFLIKGVAGGLVVLTLGIGIALARGRQGVERFGGLLVAATVTLLLLQSDLAGLSQIAGVVLLAVAGFAQRGIATGALFAIPGAFLVIRPDIGSEHLWMPWFALIALVLAAPVVAAFDHRYGDTGLSHPLFGIATFGVFLTVPDTEGAMVLLGVAGIAGFLGWPRPFVTLGASGSYAAVGVYAFVAAGGASPRPAAIIASMAVLGLLLIVPIVMRLRSTGWSHELDHVDALDPLIAQLLVVLMISRTAGPMPNVKAAAALTLVLFGAAGVVVLLRRRPAHLRE